MLKFDKSTNEFVIQPPPRLLDRILRALKAEKLAASFRKKFVLAAVVFLGLAVLMLPAAWDLGADLKQSGLGQYLPLMFSDFKAVTANWQDYSLDVLESLPSLSLSLVLFVVCALLLSLKLLTKYAKGGFSRSLSFPN